MDWVKIEGYENYSVNIKGEVRNDKSERILKLRLNQGYYQVDLYKNCVGKKVFRLHRLIAKAFIPNPNNYLLIDHKNCIRSDNSIENLRWCDHSQNSRNRKKCENTSSKYRGICFEKRNNKWKVCCSLNGKLKHIGYYKTEIEAAEAYNNFVRENNLEDYNIMNII